MATLRVRFRLNPGRKGIPLGKLSKQTENIELFLRALAADLGADDTKNLWLADDFRNSSVISTSELQAVVTLDTAVQFNEALNALVKFTGTGKSAPPPYIGAATIERFSELRQCLDADEQLGIALIDVNSGKAKRFSYVDRVQLEAISQSIETESTYIGAVMGRTHEWNTGADKPYLIVRELSSEHLVRCNYKDQDYDSVSKLFSKKTAIVIVEGQITYNLITSKIAAVQATGFDFAPDFSDKDFESFFGSSPNIIGGYSSEEYVSRGRTDDH